MDTLTLVIDWLNSNQGVVATVVPILTAIFFGIRALVSMGRNPEAPTYGAPRPFADFATLFRSFLAPIWKQKHRKGLDTITIGYLGFAFDYLPLFVARRRNLFRGLGRKRSVVYRRFDTYNDLETALKNSEVDFIAMSSVPASRLRCAGSEIYAIELLSAHAQCIVTPWPNVSVMRDLCGSRIATTEYSSSHFGALAAFETIGVECEKDVFHFMSEADGRKMLRKGDVSAWAIWPLHADYEVVLSSTREVVGSDVPVYSVLVHAGEPTDKSLFIARTIRDGLRNAKNWIAENEHEAVRFAQREFGVPRKVVVSAWRRFAFSAQLNPETTNDFMRDGELMARHNWFSQEEAKRLHDFVRLL